MTSRGHALGRDELVRVLTAYSGITTADGAIGGTTLVDANLIDNPLIVPTAIPEKTILITTGTSAGEDKGAASFNNVNGTITLQGTGFNTQILRGTVYRILNISSVEIDVKNISDKLGAFTAAENLKAILGNLSTAKRLGQILGALTEVDTLKAIIGGYTAAAPLKAAIDAIIAAITAISVIELTTFTQETAPATDVNGTTWKDLLDRSTITKPTKICGFMVTVAGAWAGNAQVRITDGAGTKIFPFQDQYQEGTDFTSGAQVVFNFMVEVTVADGYKFQFRSTNGADGAGETLQLNNLDVIEVG